MSEEMWHVQVELGDIKIVTVEQMDDMYRLDLIQGSTLVWQPGMSKALPLSVVAGIDDEDEESEVMEIEPELIPEPARPPVSPRQHTITPPARIAAPAIAQRTAPPAPPLPTPDFYSPASLRPITMSGTPSFRPESSGTAGRVVLGLAVAAGVLMTLYRNDLLRPVAASAGKEAVYQKLEAALGSPGFGTTRSVATFSATLNPEPAADLATAPGAPPNAQSASKGSGPGMSSIDVEAIKATEPGAQAAKAAGASQTEKKSSSSPQRTTPVHSKAAPQGKKLKSFKSSEYDPMNAKL